MWKPQEVPVVLQDGQRIAHDGVEALGQSTTLTDIGTTANLVQAWLRNRVPRMRRVQPMHSTTFIVRQVLIKVIGDRFVVDLIRFIGERGALSPHL